MIDELGNPRAIARARRHANRADRRPCPADASGQVADCQCEPDPDELELCWQGLARCAAARRAAGQPLSAYDRQALDRYPPGETR